MLDTMHGYYTWPQGVSTGELCETANQKPAVNSLECEIQNCIMHWGQLTMWMFHSLIIAWLKGTVYLLVRHTLSGLYPMQRADKLIKDRSQFWKDNLCFLCKMQYTTWRRKKEIPRPPIGKTHLKVKLPSLNLQDFNDPDVWEPWQTRSQGMLRSLFFISKSSLVYPAKTKKPLGGKQSLVCSLPQKHSKTSFHMVGRGQKQGDLQTNKCFH